MKNVKKFIQMMGDIIGIWTCCSYHKPKHRTGLGLRRVCNGACKTINFLFCIFQTTNNQSCTKSKTIGINLKSNGH